MLCMYCYVCTDMHVCTFMYVVRYEDGYNYQNIVAPLINMEAEYDRMCKENQKHENITVG